ncbi:TatD family-associated radical SAM protein [Elusimicrobium simillimum]|uniref:TatD family nuclease-associated radical SAM protein n=1 Tax=Elusimicrobium simillimum TaxID=3143438 RepID=UPI003C6EF147
MEPKDISIVYRFKNSLYINLTNRCPNLCSFCIKTKWAMQFGGYNLNLAGKEPSAKEVLDLIYAGLKEAPAEQIVFCGYGESTMRLPEMLEICDTLHADMASGRIPNMITRLNTVGLGSHIWGRNIVPELKGRINQIYISLNTADPGQWVKLVCPAKGYEDGFNSVVQFIKDCVGNFDRVVVSTVGGLGVDTAKMEQFVEDLGAEFYIREFLDNND